ncbi:MAG: hypothetical protein IJC39_00220 [Firmicutes bacterium]|nr:hypothetical protein [Bacillota bacterium]
MYNRKYDRKYIILDCDTKGFGMFAKDPTGTLEIVLKDGKGRLNLRLQGLKLKESTDEYKLYFVAKQAVGSVGVPALSAALDFSGSSRLSMDFDPEDVLGTGFAIEDFGAFVLLLKSGRFSDSNRIAPLCGFAERAFDWREGFREYKMKPAYSRSRPLSEASSAEIIAKPFSHKERLSSNNLKAAEESSLQTEYIQIAAPREETRDIALEQLPQKEQQPGDFEVISQRFKDELERLKSLELITEEEHEKLSAPDSISENTEHREETVCSSQKGKAKKLFECGQNVEPFAGEAAEWVNLPGSKVLELGEAALQENCYVLSRCLKYNHVLLGRIGDEYILGIPDEYSEERTGDMRTLGFLYFKSGAGAPVERNTPGYWLININ